MSRLTQRDRAKRAAMVAKFHNSRHRPTSVAAVTVTEPDAGTKAERRDDAETLGGRMETRREPLAQRDNENSVQATREEAEKVGKATEVTKLTNKTSSSGNARHKGRKLLDAKRKTAAARTAIGVTKREEKPAKDVVSTPRQRMRSASGPSVRSYQEKEVNENRVAISPKREKREDSSDNTRRVVVSGSSFSSSLKEKRHRFAKLHASKSQDVVLAAAAGSTIATPSIKVAAKQQPTSEYETTLAERSSLELESHREEVREAIANETDYKKQRELYIEMKLAERSAQEKDALEKVLPPGALRHSEMTSTSSEEEDLDETADSESDAEVESLAPSIGCEEGGTSSYLSGESPNSIDRSDHHSDSNHRSSNSFGPDGEGPNEVDETVIVNDEFHTVESDDHDHLERIEDKQGEQEVAREESPSSQHLFKDVGDSKHLDQQNPCKSSEMLSPSFSQPAHQANEPPLEPVAFEQFQADALSNFGFQDDWPSDNFSPTSWGSNVFPDSQGGNFGASSRMETRRDDDADWQADFEPLECEIEARDSEEFNLGDEDKENVLEADPMSPHSERNHSDTLDDPSIDYEGFGDKTTSFEQDDAAYSIASEETTNNSTEFDPLSMFGGCDDDAEGQANPQQDSNFAFADCNATWASPTIVRPDDSKSISFASLNSGSLAPKLPTQPTSNNATITTPKVIKTLDSPAGTESLESWWQSRHAATQNESINSAVHEAFLKQAEEETGVVENETCLVAAEEMVPQEDFTVSVEGDDPSKDPAPAPTGEDDSIFSGLDDGSVRSIANHCTTTKKPGRRHPSSGSAISKVETEEDIFDGMSINSRTSQQLSQQLSQQCSQQLSQSQFPRLKESNAVKSQLDGTTAGESFHTSKHCDSLAQTEKGYGTIDLPRRAEGNGSPCASITSDITSSVIDFERDRDSTRKPSMMRLLETTAEETPSRYGVTSPVAEEYEDKDMNVGKSKSDITDEEKEFSKNASRVVSLMSPSTDSITHRSPRGDSYPRPRGGSASFTETREDAKEYVVGGANESISILSKFGSKFGCGLFSTSSFAFCAQQGVPPNKGAFDGIDDKAISNASSPTESSGPDSSDSQDSREFQSRFKDRDSDDISESGGEDHEMGQESDELLGSGSSTERGSSSQHECSDVEAKFDDPTASASTTDASVSTTTEESEADKSEPEKPAEVLNEGVTNNDVHLETTFVKVEGTDGQSIERTLANEKLLLEAYTAKSASPQDGSCGGGSKESLEKILNRMTSAGGVEVLKLNKSKKWQQRYLSFTTETLKFVKTNDGIESCPKGLLWKKQQNGKNGLTAISKNGKGGILFSNVHAVAITKDKFSLSKKQQKGKFSNAVTLVLQTSPTQNMTRENVMFRCANKEEAYDLVNGFQAIIDRIKNFQAAKGKSLDRWEV